MRLGVARPQTERRGEAVGRLVKPPFQTERVPQIVERFDGAWLDREGLLVTANRTGPVPGLIERQPEVVVRVGEAWLQTDRFPVAGDRVIDPPLKFVRAAQVPSKDGVGRLGGHRTFEEPGRFRNPPALLFEKSHLVQSVGVRGIDPQHLTELLFRANEVACAMQLQPLFERGSQRHTRSFRKSTDGVS